MWNQKLSDRPPLNTYKAPNKNLDLTKLRNALHYGLEHFTNDNLWNTEISLLCRIIYRMKMKFRSSKDFKLLEKLKRHIEKCYEINVGKQLKIFLSMVPQKYESTTYLPTKNMLDYILVKLQGLAKVFVKSYETCLQVCAEINQRLYIGHFWNLFFIVFALVSRLSILIKFKTKFVCDLYAKLLPYSQQLKNDGPNWLPKDQSLPKDLKVWLEVLWVYEEECVDLTFEPNTVDFMNLMEEEDEDVMFWEEYIMIDDEDKRIAKDFQKLAPVKDVLNNNCDEQEDVVEVDAEEELLVSSEDEVESNNFQDSVIFIGETKSGKAKKRSHLDPVIIEEDIDVGEEVEYCGPVQKKPKKQTLKQIINEEVIDLVQPKIHNKGMSVTSVMEQHQSWASKVLKKQANKGEASKGEWKKGPIYQKIKLKQVLKSPSSKKKRKNPKKKKKLS